MVKSDMEIEAVNIAYTLGLEDSCHPHDILTTYLHNKIKDIRNGSYFQMVTESLSLTYSIILKGYQVKYFE